MSKNAASQSCQPIPEPVRRFNIHWGDGRYSVDIPNYGGGEVVDASAYDALEFGIAAVAFAMGWTDLKGMTVEEYAATLKADLAQCTEANHHYRDAVDVLETALRAIDSHLDNFGYGKNMKARKIVAAALNREAGK